MNFIEIHGVGGETVVLNSQHILSIWPINAARAKLTGTPNPPPPNTKCQINLVTGMGLFVTDDYPEVARKLGMLLL